MKVKIIVTNAARRAGVIGDTEYISGNLEIRLIYLLNNMLSAWKNDGVDLKQDEITSDGNIYLDPTDIDAVHYNFAARIQDEVFKEVDQTLAFKAKGAKDAVFNKYSENLTLEMPAHLKGAGSKSSIDTLQ